MSDCRILIFLKAPIKGYIKTRLSQSLGENRVLELYRCFVRDVLKKAGSQGDVTLFYYPSDKRRETAAMTGEEFELVVQDGADLGDKMACAFEYEFNKGTTAAILIGTDVPDVPESMLREASEALGEHQAVIGPVGDGGYFLIGFTRAGFTRKVFEGIHWSTPTVFEKTVEILRQNRISYHVLPLWYDVDTGEDYEALVSRLRSGLSQAPHTLKFILDHETHHFDHHSCSE